MHDEVTYDCGGLHDISNFAEVVMIFWEFSRVTHETVAKDNVYINN